MTGTCQCEGRGELLAGHHETWRPSPASSQRAGFPVYLLLVGGMEWMPSFVDVQVLIYVAFVCSPYCVPYSLDHL